MKSARILFMPLLSFAPLAADAQPLYDFGDPTADEQYYIELINRARANPPAEGERLAAANDPDVLTAVNYFSVDLAMMREEFNAIPPAPPLAPNAALTAAARGHSAWMLANGTQSHTQPGNNPGTRIAAAGYSPAGWGENIYASAKNVWHGHVGFQIDWGTGGTGGMQPGRGHRTSIHNSNFREIGVGVTYGTNTVGPTQVTQDFGRQFSSPSFGTGVAYYDLNGNGFYDPGEGISGISVRVSGASSQCLTASGGGWVVPVPAASATRTVTFSGLGIEHSAGLAFPADANGKLDLRLAYEPPVITTAAVAYAGRAAAISFTPVRGAAAYDWRRWTLAAAAPEECESTANITAQTYNDPVLKTNLRHQGSASFQLRNGSPGADRWIELNRLYRGEESPVMTFRSRLLWSMASESYRVQVREEGESDWIDVYQQAGFGGSGESSFILRTVDLSAVAHKTFRVRFLLHYGGGSWYIPSDTTGWYIDDIRFSGLRQLDGETTTRLSGTGGSFVPAAPGALLQAVLPIISGRTFPGAFQMLTISDGAPPGFASWAADLENLHSLPAGSIADPDGDPDGDGRANLLEYAFGTSPVLAAEPASRWPVVSFAEPGFLAIDYQVDTSLAGLTYTPETGSDLDGWFSPGQPGTPAGFTDELLSTDGSLQARRATLALVPGGRGFVRIRVTQDP